MQRILDKIDEYPAQAVCPAVFDGQPNPIQHQAVESRRLQREVAVKEGLGHTVKAGRARLVSVEVIQIKLHNINLQNVKEPRRRLSPGLSHDE